MSKKFVCTVCGYIHEGDAPPEKCPKCNVPAEKFKEQVSIDGISWIDGHVVGVAQGSDAEIMKSLKKNFKNDCKDVAVLLAMARQADREGYPEISETLIRIAMDETDHAAKLAELIGDELVDNTEKNIEKMLISKHESCNSKKELSTKSKQLNLDAIHDTTHEMCKDDARHGSALNGLLKRYF